MAAMIVRIAIAPTGIQLMFVTQRVSSIMMVW
jgi:hypothetical protein